MNTYNVLAINLSCCMVQLVTSHTKIHCKYVPLTVEHLTWQNVALHNADIAHNLHCLITEYVTKVTQFLFVQCNSWLA
jgi:hypothetical protein